MNVPLLSHVPLEAGYPERFTAAGFQLHYAITPESRVNLDPAVAESIRAVLTIGTIGLTGEEMDKLPNLAIICAQGVGYELVDVAAAKQRGIVVTHGPGTNSSSVADHTLALMLAITRQIPQMDAKVRRSDWTRAGTDVGGMFGKKLGILGLGNIGEQIARRCAGGFDMAVGYHNRNPLTDSLWRYFDSLHALAEWADYLVVATPGGQGTAKLVDASVLRALGEKGFLINISRGSVVDTQALVASLTQGDIAGAALDVIDGEPKVPEEIIPLTNLVITPHIGGRSPEAMNNMMTLVIDNLLAHFGGAPVLTPVRA
ncbi:2-hydroxyacid dehydrogenase [Pseudomonas reactans]|nr:2-hydroxyacid dehydrogenase [Pseudomonas reactans]